MRLRQPRKARAASYIGLHSFAVSSQHSVGTYLPGDLYFQREAGDILNIAEKQNVPLNVFPLNVFLNVFGIGTSSCRLPSASPHTREVPTRVLICHEPMRGESVFSTTRGPWSDTKYLLRR